MTGISCWSVPAALICAGLLAMAAAVALAAVQEARGPVPPPVSSNGAATEAEVPVE